MDGDEWRTTHPIGWPPKGEDKMHFILPGSEMRMLEKKEYTLTIRNKNDKLLQIYNSIQYKAIRYTITAIVMGTLNIKCQHTHVRAH